VFSSRGVLSDKLSRGAQSCRDALAALATPDAITARAAPAARAALAARSTLECCSVFDRAQELAVRNAGRDLLRFAAWCINAYGGFFRFDLSWISTTWMGAITEAVKAWSGPLFEAYLAGAWLLHWTPDTLFWVTKPRLSIERPSAQLHNTGGPAVESLGK